MKSTAPPRIALASQPVTVVATCPHCGHAIKVSERLSYPMSAIGHYTTVYRCRGCRKHVGEPVG
jgi:DNA-directed RNA polymerase subunit RPC12/RpoP